MGEQLLELLSPGYDAYTSGQRGWALAGSIVKGAGTGALTGFIGGHFVGAGASVATSMTQNIGHQTVRKVVSTGVEAGVETVVDTGIALATGNPISLKNVATDFGMNLFTNGAGSVATKRGSKADVNTSKPKGGDVEVAKSPEEIIAERTKDLDLRPHPTNQKQLSPKKLKELKQKLADRTITREEYEQLDWNKRFAKRRRDGVDEFWVQEQDRLLNGENGSRNWTPEQRESIINGNKAQFDGKTLQGHHTYSASQYPHLANRPEVIYPATFNEHFRGWHGGNWKTSLPGERIAKISDF